MFFTIGIYLALLEFKIIWILRLLKYILYLNIQYSFKYIFIMINAQYNIILEFITYSHAFFLFHKEVSKNQEEKEEEILKLLEKTHIVQPI